MNQERSRSADSKVDWLDDGGAEQVDQPETEDEGQEVSRINALGCNDEGTNTSQREERPTRVDRCSINFFQC